MLINKDIAISTPSILLVPYESHHVPTYHTWMKDKDLQEATASEPLSLTAEHSMQESWRQDPDKLTFIACLPDGNPGTEIIAGQQDAPAQMLGDVNLFLTPADEDAEGCIGELELMIAPVEQRRRGFGRGTVLAFLQFIENHLEDIMREYGASVQEERMRLLQLKVKIGSKNVKSINLFDSIGFLRVSEGENYFGEVELVFEGFVGKGTRAVEGYTERLYRKS